jgi:Zn-finger nucleic acid-binding protein
VVPLPNVPAVSLAAATHDMMRAMDCRNCGAPMELFATRGYYFCTYCGTFEFIPAPAVEGVQVLERSAGTPPCPVCGGTLAVALLDGASRVEHCETCRGLLIACPDFADAVARRRARAPGPPARPVPLDRRDLKRHLNCPSCRAPMDVHPYYGPGNVVIDTCSRCEVVWLDFGELKQITDAPGRDRGGLWTPRTD